ncbi:TAXI family TRAP transporter solute-binding subunit [Marinobacter salexigens]|uniref:TAXI family TRAP transporter solute-binding subunit n=1 Tax=Marinobacter salexigens TaxID=1925763 RepID=A0ABS6AAF4_9GAMM|nr:TAXI family TRAP transporter solute-binding subunit [Marinobacter salexigens]MBU2874660.1 TAXI family TRAP transporter solute-binding subunit [Marinobacter salexigens]
MLNLRTVKRTVCLFLAALMLSTSVTAWAEDTIQLRMHTASPGTSYFVVSTTMQTVLQKSLPVKINLTSGMASPRSALDASSGQVDFYISSPAINQYMQTGTAMFANMPSAPELSEELRSVFNFPTGPYHIVTYADSGIESLDDIKGKRVFLGPPGGSATTTALGIIEAATGFEPGEDFEQSRLDWSSGQQAFQDRQVDLMIIPTEMPSALISQFALLNDIRLIGLSEDDIKTPRMQEILGIVGRTIERIPPDLYGDSQANDGSVVAIGAWAGIGTHAGVEEEIVYKVTKTIFENIKAFHQAADWMKVITLETALSEMNVPLHAGAYRYYKEAGVEVPSDLIPPGVKDKL